MMEARYIDNTENLLKKLKMNNIFAVCLMAYTATVTVLNVRELLVRAATGADEREIVDSFWKKSLCGLFFLEEHYRTSDNKAGLSH